jgi:isopenicillin N synthase-like dioxygenase
MKIKEVDLESLHSAEDFASSLEETGFAVVTNHGIPKEVFDRTYRFWNDFFQSEDKHRFLHAADSQEGYFPMKSEKAKDATVADLKEFYHYFGNTDQKLPGKTNEEFATIRPFLKLEKLALELLRIAERRVPSIHKEDCGENWAASAWKSKNTLLRILHYPPVPGNPEGAIRSAAHEDINFITLLPAATQPGLEVKDLSGNWHAINVSDSNSIIVNAGDMLQEATAGYYKSTTHRVVNPADSANVSRLSMPLFLHPDPSLRLSKRHTADSYLQERLREILQK